MELSKIPIKIKYQTLRDNVIEEFYVPVLSSAKFYLRSAGFFSSSVLLDYIDGLEQFVENDGKMKLLISPTVSQVDAEALLDSTNPMKDIKCNLSMLFREYKENGELYEVAAKILIALITEGFLTVKVAVPKNPIGIYHEKIAIFIDAFGHKIATIGSNNETSNALKNNIESFNTFCSWKNGQWEYIKLHEDDFNTFWNNQSSSIEAYDLLDAIDKNVLSLYETKEKISNLFSELRRKKNSDEVVKSLLSFEPYSFQRDAANHWIQKKRGIISYATGVGKTKTAIYCIFRYLEEYKRGFFLIVVPDKTLAHQWSEELERNNYSNLVCFSENPNWRQLFNDGVDSWKYNYSDKVFVVTTKQTFSSDYFQRTIKKLRNEYIFIVDECHHVGTTNYLSRLPDTEYRLGLSATPEIYMQEERTNKLMDYFSGVLDTYSIRDAIDNEFLVPYEYYPIIVELTINEKEEYDKLTKQIVKIIGTKDESKIKNADNILELLLFKRAKIVYGAYNKLEALENILDDLSHEDYFLIYCGVSSTSSHEENDLEVENESQYEAETQLTSVNNLLNKHGIPSSQYTQSENNYERSTGLKAFRNGDIKSLVAIKCLDEGVDIPEIRKALIMASSGNPREYIQRRGRLLRKYEGKKKAIIYDMLVFSPDESYRSINRVELKRLQIFAKDAINSDKLLKEYNCYIKEFVDEENEDE